MLYITFGLLIIVIIILLYLVEKSRKNIWIIKIRTLKRHNGKISLGDFFGHLYGLLGLIGLAITIIGLFNSYKSIDDENVIYMISTLSYSLIVIVIAYLFTSGYYVTKFSKYKNFEAENRRLEDHLKKQYVINKYQAELCHNITHYARNINARLFEFASDEDSYSYEDIEDLKDRFHDFLVILTSNLQAYFSFITNDNCTVTIKKVTSDKKHVKTFFRDPINFNKRKKSDHQFSENNGEYLISENTAFSIITDPNLKNNFYYDDNLGELADSGKYQNSNHDWVKLYNATLVVPIAILLKTDTRDIIGFITVDNMKGNLAVDNNKEFLFSIGDLFYNTLLRYSNFITFVESK